VLPTHIASRSDLRPLPFCSQEEEEQSAALLLGYEEGTWPKIQREWPEWDDLEEVRVSPYSRLIPCPPLHSP
jgi:hypothetical protein